MVQELHRDMMKEAEAEDTPKAYCDEEMAETKIMMKKEEQSEAEHTEFMRDTEMERTSKNSDIDHKQSKKQPRLDLIKTNDPGFHTHPGG